MGPDRYAEKYALNHVGDPMGENSKIEWCDHTFNPWIGCQKVSHGCDHCYAETMMDRRYHRVQWGPHGERMQRDVPAVIRFISYEPALGPLVIGEAHPDWIICGGESGAGDCTRFMEPAWARSVRDECGLAGVAFFMKQMTRKRPIPSDLLVREFPRGDAVRA